MKQLIRKNTFETNSSSMHSLSILNTNKDGNLEDLNFTIGFGEYGLERDVLTAPRSIINYLWTMCNSMDIDSCKKYRNLMLEWLPNCKFEEAKIEKNTWGGDPYFYYDIDGYIDHVHDWYEENGYWDGEAHPINTAISEMFENKETFKQIIFNGKIITASDGGVWNKDIDDFDSYPDSDSALHTYLSEAQKIFYNDSFIPSNAIKTWVKGN